MRLSVAILLLAAAATASAAEPKQPLKAKSIVFVIDCGGSTEKFGDHIRAQLAKWVPLLTEGQSLDVVTFREQAASVFGKLAPASDLNRSKAAKGVEEAVFGGPADMKAGLTEAFNRKPAAVILLTTTARELTEADFKALSAAYAQSSPQVTVYRYMIAGSDADQRGLASLVKKSGGSFREIDNPGK